MGPSEAASRHPVSGASRASPTTCARAIAYSLLLNWPATLSRPLALLGEGRAPLLVLLWRLVVGVVLGV